eukprot:scaffold22078_cov33-Tisochrysis_lutea.AAC.10
MLYSTNAVKTRSTTSIRMGRHRIEQPENRARRKRWPWGICTAQQKTAPPQTQPARTPNKRMPAYKPEERKEGTSFQPELNSKKTEAVVAPSAALPPSMPKPRQMAQASPHVMERASGEGRRLLFSSIAIPSP